MSLHAVHGLAVVTALPVVAEALHGRALYGAALASYLLASLAGLVAAGGSCDRSGPARPFGAGLALFGAGIAGSGAAPSMPVFVACRALEGLGGGMLSAVLYACVQRAYPDGQRARVLAWLSAAWVLPGILAPPAAGAVAERFGWRLVFFGLLPGVVACAALALPPLLALGRGRADRAVAPPEPGLLGAAARLVTGAGLVLAGASLDLGPGVALAAWLVGIGLAGPALVRLLPEGTLRAAPGLPASIAAKTLLLFAFFAADSFLPLAIVDVCARSAAFAGLVLTVGSLSWTAGAFLQARFSGKPAALQVGLAAALILTGLLLVLGMLAPGARVELAFGGWTLAGLGMGIGYNAANATAMSAAAPGREGATSTALGIADALGAGIASALGGVVLAAGERAGADAADSLARVFSLAALSTFAVLLAGARMDPARPWSLAIRSRRA